MVERRSLVILRPTVCAGCIPQQLIRDPSAEEPFHHIRTLTPDHDCFIASVRAFH